MHTWDDVVTQLDKLFLELGEQLRTRLLSYFLEMGMPLYAQK